MIKYHYPLHQGVPITLSLFPEGIMENNLNDMNRLQERLQNLLSLGCKVKNENFQNYFGKRKKKKKTPKNLLSLKSLGF